MHLYFIVYLFFESGQKEKQIDGRKDLVGTPLKNRIFIGALYASATTTTLHSLNYISMPTQILSKTIKILPGN